PPLTKVHAASVAVSPAGTLAWIVRDDVSEGLFAWQGDGQPVELDEAAGRRARLSRLTIDDAGMSWSRDGGRRSASIPAGDEPCVPPVGLRRAAATLDAVAAASGWPDAQAWACLRASGMTTIVLGEWYHAQLKGPFLLLEGVESREIRRYDLRSGAEV